MPLADGTVCGVGMVSLRLFLGTCICKVVDLDEKDQCSLCGNTEPVAY